MADEFSKGAGAGFGVVTGILVGIGLAALAVIAGMVFLCGGCLFVGGKAVDDLSEPRPSATNSVEAETETQDVPVTARTWTSGEYSVEGTLVDCDGEAVSILKEDGETANVPLSILSRADIDYVKSRGKPVGLYGTPPLSRSFFGLTLGADVSEFGELEEFPYGSNMFGADDAEGVELISKRYSLLDMEPPARQATLVFYKDKLYDIGVFMADHSATTVEAFEKRLTEEYGEPREPLFSLDDVKVRSIEVDGREVVITSRASYDSYYIIYNYVELEELAEEELKSTTTDQIADQL